MKYILSVLDSGPLSMRARRETSGAETRTYVPGATVLGALAAAHAQADRSRAEFDAFFGPQSRFSNLYPAAFKPDDLNDVDAIPVYPLPATAVSCKRFGGFRYDQDLNEDDPHHGVYDTAAAGTLFAMLEEAEKKLGRQPKLDVLSFFDRCHDADSGCNEPMDRFEGYYRRSRFDAAVAASAQVRRGLRTRVGISRLTGAAAEGILYSREVLNAGTTYWGTAVVPDECAEAFAAFVQEISAADLLRLGNNRTRGFGRAALTTQPLGPGASDSADALLARMKAFDAHLRDTARKAKIAADHKLYVPVTLTSDAVLPDRLLRYRTRIDGDYLSEVWRIDGAKLLFQSGGTRRVMGWNAALGVPKADDAAITLGSVFVFGLDRQPDNALAAKFFEMQEQSIGARRREGFGQIVVAGPFHYEVNGQ